MGQHSGSRDPRMVVVAAIRRGVLAALCALVVLPVNALADDTQQVSSTPTVGAASASNFLRTNADGSRALFSTSDRLDPVLDTDGNTDIYEWNQGVRRLISTG